MIMGRFDKKVPKSNQDHRSKTVSGEKHSTDNERVQWCFDKLDRDGKFAFDLSRKDFDHHEVLEKIIAYSNMTWIEAKMQTHDRRNKSKHHNLDFPELSPEAVERFNAKKFNDKYEDAIFSFACQNTLRIIGIRINEKFHVVWFDPKHEFCPSKKR